MDPHILRIVSRGKTPATGRLEHLPKLWLHAPVRFELACAAPEDTAAALAATPTYSISIHSLDAARQPVDDPLLWYDEVASQTANDGKSKGPHAIFDLSAADIANITAAGEYWLAFHAYPGGERIVRAAGYLTFADDGFPTDPPTPTPPGTVYLTQAAGDSRYVRDPGTVVDNRLVRWDGVSGNTVQSSLVTVGDDGSISTPGTFTANRVKVKTGTYEGDVTSSLLTNDRAHALPNADGTLALTTNVNGAPDRMELRVKCDEAGGVTLGQAVYIYGANGGNKLIRKAIASGEATSSKTIGLVSQALAHNAFGYVVTEGHVDVSLAKGSAVEGDPVWLSPATAGGVVFGVAAKPSAPNHMVFMGYVTRITGANVTEIFVKVQNGFELEEIHNVAITTPSTGHVLTWNGTLWVNAAPTGGGGSVTVTGQDGIGVAGSPGTSITLSLGNITPDSLTVSGVSSFNGYVNFQSVVNPAFSVEVSAANLFEGGNILYWPTAPGTLALVGNDAGQINSDEITDGTTVGRSIFKLTNPEAVTFLRMNANNTVTARSAADFRTDLGLGALATQSGTSSGTNTGDQTITLTGDVTGSGTGSFAATIAASAVTYAKMQAVSAASRLLGRGTAGTTAVREVSLGTGLSMSGDVLSATATGGGTNTILQFFPRDAEFPSTGFATIDTRNNHPCLDFDDTTVETVYFTGFIPQGASFATSGTALTFVLLSTATSALTGNIGWLVALERIVANGIDIDGDDFGTAQPGSAAVIGGANTGKVTEVSVTFTLAQLPSLLAAGDMIRVRVQRNTSVSGDHAGDAELLGVYANMTPQIA